MPRRRLPASVGPNMVWDECLRKKVNPVEELIKLATWRARIEIGDMGIEELQRVMSRYDLDREGDKTYLVPRLMDRFEIWKELSGYIAPKLRSSEVTSTEDKTITVILKTFDGGETKTIEIGEKKELTDGD